MNKNVRSLTFLKLLELTSTSFSFSFYVNPYAFFLLMTFQTHYLFHKQAYATDLEE